MRSRPMCAVPPREGGASSKTSQYDEALSFDLAQHGVLGPVFAELKKTTPGVRVFGYTGLELHNLVTKAAADLHLEALGVVPYSCRHCGPSSDRASQARSLEEIQQRGRWRSFNSVRRYEKAPRLQEQMESLTKAQRALALRCAANIHLIMAGKVIS